MFNIKKRLFKKLLRNTQGEIWDSEFNIFTARNERETARQQHDITVNAIEMIKANPKTNKEQLEKVEIQLDTIKANMDEFDIILSGVAPNEQYPEGKVGLEMRLENQIKRKKNIEAFIRQSC